MEEKIFKDFKLGIVNETVLAIYMLLRAGHYDYEIRELYLFRSHKFYKNYSKAEGYFLDYEELLHQQELSKTVIND